MKKVSTLQFLLITVYCISPTYSNGSDNKLKANKTFIRPCFPDDEVASICRDQNDPCHEPNPEQLLLTKLDGVKTGHIQHLELEEGKKFTLITRAMKPVVFEIPNFLSHEECDHIINLAKVSGLAQSVAGFDNQAYEGELDRELAAVDETKPALGPDDILAERFDTWDKDGNDIITFDEIARFALEYDTLYLNRKDVAEMLKKLGLKHFENCQISHEEFHQLSIKKLLAYFWYLKDKHPRHRPRYSEQAWLHVDRTADPMLRGLQDRITKLTQLPRKIIKTSESIQVVRYERHGHYHGHLDSSPITNKGITCCHQNVKKAPACKLCRFLTILYYLNDVEEGGETAFVVADNATHTIHESLVSPNGPADEFNLSAHCKLAQLVIPPKKGTAIMWYNHFIDPVSGLLGGIDHYSFHGGCDITKGVKWIANNWINAATTDTAHIRSIYDNGMPG